MHGVPRPRVPVPWIGVFPLHLAGSLRLFGVGLVVLAVAGAGCGLRITEVSGTVRIDGKPAKGLQVVFQPEQEGLPRALAATDAQGVYRLGRQGPGKPSGAAAGKYVVRVNADSDDPQAPQIPERYGAKSELRFDVKPGMPNTFDIDISTK